MYAGQVVYEVKCQGREWLMRFLVAKRLNALHEVSSKAMILSFNLSIIHMQFIKKSLPPTVEKDVHLSFTFEDGGYIELSLNEKQERPFNEWNIDSHQDLMVGLFYTVDLYTFLDGYEQIYKRDVDKFGSEDPPSCSSILITVSAEQGSDTVTRIKYCVPLKGIKPDNRKIFIVRSLSSNDGE